MKNTKSVFVTIILISLFILSAIYHEKTYTYPKTKKLDVTDNYHGTIVSDPYRWLEDDQSKQTKNWVQAQNKVTNTFLNKIPFRGKIKERL